MQFLLALAPRTAQAMDVLVVYADDSLLTTFEGDVRSKVAGSGRFALVDDFDANLGTPTLATLLNYDAVLVFSDTRFADPALLGDRLADYVDSGGGVVEGMFTSYFTAGVSGRFVADGYQPIVVPAGVWSFADAHSMSVPVLDASHPVMAGVQMFESGVFGYRIPYTTFSASAAPLAVWDDGLPFVAANTRVVALNFFLPSNDVAGPQYAVPVYWDPTTSDGEILIANALEWVGRPDLDGDGLEDSIDNCFMVANADQADSDGDGRGDACDQCDAATEVDTDEDGICDGVDVCPGFDDWVDTDADGVPDGCDPCPVDNPDDDDGDDVCNSVDICVGFPNVDADSDTICDSTDACPGGDDNSDTDDDGQADFCDCAPFDAAAMTGGVEVCDGHDNDCDGIVDNEGTPGQTVFYIDVDGDGFGVDGSAESRCERPLNYADVGGDCDDASASVNPDAAESCDGIDNNCDGILDPSCDAGGSGAGCGCDAAEVPTSGALGLLAVLLAAGRRRVRV